MTQLALLATQPTSPPAIEGLIYRPGFIGPDEEVRLIAHVDAQPWNNDWRRRRQVYGTSYGPSGAHVREAGVLPSWLDSVVDAALRQGLLHAPVLNAVINEYRPGEGIGMHLDYPGFERVVAVSLGAPVFLDLEEPSTGRRESLDLAARSAWAVSGAARHHWRHGIAARRNDVVDGHRRPRERRVSITLRSA